MKNKYVRLKRLDEIIIFHEMTVHSTFKHREPISAGFIKFVDGKAICYGESDSLELKSSPEDSEIATFQLFNK